MVALSGQLSNLSKRLAVLMVSISCLIQISCPRSQFHIGRTPTRRVAPIHTVSSRGISESDHSSS
jgi:hypothetical protein